MGRIGKWTWVHVATICLVLALLLWLGRGLWFFGDEWDFLRSRGLHHPRFGLWRPHNEHWSTLPILWYRALFSLFGLKSYWPYIASLFALHLAAMHCIWRLMRRAGVVPPIAAGIALVFGLYGAGSENLLWAFQIGFVGSLVAGLLLLLAVDDRGGGRRVAAVSLGAVLSLMLSGISVVMIAAVGVAAYARWGLRKALAVVTPSAVTYLVWLRGPGSVGLSGDTAKYHGTIGDIPRFVWGGLSATFGRPFHDDRVGEVLLLVLLVVVATRAAKWWKTAPDVLALGAAAPALFAVISQGRGFSQSPASSRYLYLAAAMLLPLIGLAVHDAVRRRRLGVAVAVALSLCVGAVGAQQLRDAGRNYRARDLSLKGQLLASLVVAAKEPTLVDRPDFAYARDLTTGDLAAFRAAGRLPAVAPTDADLAAARLALELRVSRARAGAALGGATAAVSSIAVVTPRGGCVSIKSPGADIVVSPLVAGRTSAFSITPSSAGTALLFVPYATGNAGPRAVQLRPGVRVTIFDALADKLLLRLPAGTQIVCGLRW